MDQPTPDELTEGGTKYTYRDGQWTTRAGYCVSTSQGQALTLKFYEQHGRGPLSEPVPPPPRSKRTKSVSR